MSIMKNTDCTLKETKKYIGDAISSQQIENIPDNKVHGANMGPTWGRQDPGGPHVGHMNLVIWDASIITLPFSNRLPVWCMDPMVGLNGQDLCHKVQATCH